MALSIFRLSMLAGAGAACAALTGCGKQAPKPSEAEIAAYLAGTNPAYLHMGQVTARYESAASLGSGKLPDGSWRVHVRFMLVAGEDLFGPTQQARAYRAEFDRTVAAMEQFRLARIEAAGQLGARLGLVAPGASAPEPAMTVAVATHKGESLADEVDLLAEPDGSSWKFFQFNAQSLDEDATGAPLAQLKRDHPRTVYVLAGSDEAKAYEAREQRFLQIVSHAPKP